jgi:hypothetical protein
MTGNPNILKTLDDPIRTDVGLPLGEDGCYFIGDNPTGFSAGSPPNFNQGSIAIGLFPRIAKALNGMGKKSSMATSLGCNTL